MQLRLPDILSDDPSDLKRKHPSSSKLDRPIFAVLYDLTHLTFQCKKELVLDFVDHI